MTYNIINNEEELDKFISLLPDNDIDGTYYITLFARKKYAPNSNLKSDKAQLKTLVAKKERIKQKIKQLEVKIGAYTTDDGQPIPEESLALYITPNPRSFKKANKEIVRTIFGNLLEGIHINPKVVTFSKLQTAQAEKKFVIFDVDYSEKNEYKQAEFLKTVAWKLGYTPLIIKTRGGFHILVEPSKTTEKVWHQNISVMADQIGDLLSPIPGCIQGGHIPYLINYENEKYE